MTINQRIFDTLKAQGKTQTDMAGVLNVRVATVSEWKRERTTPSASVVGQIAEYLCVSTDYLISGKEYTPAMTVNQGIIGDRNKNNTVTIHGNGTVQLSEFESELLRVYSSLDARGKNALLSYAYKLESEMSEV